MNQTTIQPLFQVLTTITSIYDPDGCCLTISLKGTEVEICQLKTEPDSIYHISSANRLFRAIITKMRRRIKAVGITEFDQERRYCFLPWPRITRRYFSELEVSKIWRCDHRVYIRPANPSIIGEVRPLQDTIRLYDGQFVVNYGQISKLTLDFSDLAEIQNEAEPMLLLNEQTLS